MKYIDRPTVIPVSENNYYTDALGKSEFFLQMQYLKNEAHISGKTMGHC